MTFPFEISIETTDHAAQREMLLDAVMGPIRFRRTSQRLRDGREPAAGLSFVALSQGKLAGTVRLWKVRACGLADALLLGPLAVAAQARGSGIGTALIDHSLTVSSQLGHDAIILVGDAPYYGRFGFSAHNARRLSMPGPFERHRLLALALSHGALDGAHGLLRPCGSKTVQPQQMASAA